VWNRPETRINSASGVGSSSFPSLSRTMIPDAWAAMVSALKCAAARVWICSRLKMCWTLSRMISVLVFAFAMVFSPLFALRFIFLLSPGGCRGGGAGPLDPVRPCQVVRLGAALSRRPFPLGWRGSPRTLLPGAVGRLRFACCGCIVARPRVDCQARRRAFSLLHKKHVDVL